MQPELSIHWRAMVDVGWLGAAGHHRSIGHRKKLPLIPARRASTMNHELTVCLNIWRISILTNTDIKLQRRTSSLPDVIGGCCLQHQ